MRNCTGGLPNHWSEIRPHCCAWVGFHGWRHPQRSPPLRGTTRHDAKHRFALSRSYSRPHFPALTRASEGTSLNSNNRRCCAGFRAARRMCLTMRRIGYALSCALVGLMFFGVPVPANFAPEQSSATDLRSTIAYAYADGEGDTFFLKEAAITEVYALSLNDTGNA